MQAGVGSIAVGPYQQVAARLDGCQGRLVNGNLPLDGIRKVVCQVHAADIKCIDAGVIDFDPVIVLFLWILGAVVI